MYTLVIDLDETLVYFRQVTYFLNNKIINLIFIQGY